MNKKINLFLLIMLCFLLSAMKEKEDDNIDLSSLADYQKEFVGDEIGVCSYSATKTYMDYRSITSTTSKQYRYIHEYMHVDDSGLLLDDNNFIGVALGSYYGEIGDRYYFTLDTGIVLPLIKVEEKADIDTQDGCNHGEDGSVIEFVIDGELAQNYFGRYPNGLILSGNFNNYDYFKGKIKKVEIVTDEKNPNYVIYEEKDEHAFDAYAIFTYNNGY